MRSALRHLEERRYEDAAAELLELIASGNVSADAYALLGMACRNLERLPLAARLLRIARGLDPSDPEIACDLASVLHELGRHDEAIARYQATCALDADHVEAWHRLAGAFVQSGRHLEGLAAATACLARDPHNVAALAWKTWALAALGRTAEARAIADCDRLVWTTDAEAPEGYPSLAAFHAELRAAILAHPTLGRDPRIRATRGGFHSENLLADQTRVAGALRALLGTCVRRFLATMRAAGRPIAGADGFTPDDLVAWAVVMERGGRQTDHIHPQAWLSGVYYVRIPREIHERGGPGWLEFAPHPEAAGDDVVRIEPQEGRAVLFPSYLLHRTVPQPSDELRICVGFDLPRG